MTMREGWRRQANLRRGMPHELAVPGSDAAGESLAGSQRLTEQSRFR
jgi:hypothetical protein